jgi:hypothetical protein
MTTQKMDATTESGEPMLSVSDHRPTIVGWVKAVVISGLLAPIFSPFFLTFIAILLFDAADGFISFLVGVLYALLFAFTLGWSVIVLTLLVFTLVIYLKYDFWVRKNRWYWASFGAALSAVAVSVLLASIGELNEVNLLIETYLSIMPSGALSAILFRRILLKHVKSSG